MNVRNHFWRVMMGTTITGEFTTRRSAEMAVERLVQDHGIERTDIFISAAGNDNTVGTEAAGADVESGHPDTQVDATPALNGMITVSVDLEDVDRASIVQDAMDEFEASDIATG
ncbi:MAG: hypothetical protein JWL66_1706 [Sphingomonadales bacterium]|nr:hypothetical protein [Sphingomonadales bacterium]